MNPNDALRSAKALVHVYELHDWTVVLDNAKGRAGITKYRQKVIGLSRMWTEIHTPEQVERTTLHEIAHALAGYGAGHGNVWKAIYRSIGGTGGTCSEVTPEQREAITYRWVGTCPAGHEYKRHRLTQGSRNGLCTYCSRWVENRRLSWVDTTLPVR